MKNDVCQIQYTNPCLTEIYTYIYLRIFCYKMGEKGKICGMKILVICYLKVFFCDYFFLQNFCLNCKNKYDF